MKIRDIITFIINSKLGALNPRISLRTYFEVEPAIYNDCPYYDSLDEAKRQAFYETSLAVSRGLQGSVINE